MKVVLASSNVGKIREFTALFSPLDMTLVPQSEWGIADVPETGLTFIENALLKARYACQQTGLPAIADDSGLVVQALKGAPGIYSARYAGEGAPAKENIAKLLNELKDVPESQRHAFFHCVLVYMTQEQEPVPLVCQGRWEGSILTVPRGEQGFGYDPIFYVPSENKSAAELPLTIKSRISHRGQALRLLVESLARQS